MIPESRGFVAVQVTSSTNLISLQKLDTEKLKKNRMVSTVHTNLHAIWLFKKKIVDFMTLIK